MSNKILSNGRGFLAHLGSYVIIITMLIGLNLLAAPGVPWVLYPALVWGAVVAIHLLVKLPLALLGTRWQKFLRHAGVYLIITGTLAGLNFLTASAVWWFLFPAFIWGALLGLHFLFGVLLPAPNGAGRDTLRGASRPKARKRPGRLSLANRNLQDHFNRVLSYQAQLDRLAATTTGEYSRKRLQSLADQIDGWVADLAELALRIDRFQRNGLLRKDLSALPKSIRNLERRLVVERDEFNRGQMKRTLENLQQQLACLEQSDRIIKRAELQIERMLSSVATIYSQILTGHSAGRVADYSRLSAEVEEQVRVLQDHMEALEEVKFSRV